MTFNELKQLSPDGFTASPKDLGWVLSHSGKVHTCKRGHERVFATIDAILSTLTRAEARHVTLKVHGA